MPLQSMTGFARSEGNTGTISWVWELRSVNGKGLDIRMRIPSGYEAVETKARNLLSKLLKRGNVTASLQVNCSESDMLPVVNEEALEAVLTAAQTLQTRVGGQMPSTAELMAIKGVMEAKMPDLSNMAREERNKGVLEGLHKAALSLSQMRADEGGAVVDVLREQIMRISALLAEINNNDARTPNAIEQQLKEQVEKLLKNVDGLDPQRLYQEAAILAAKADIQEELDRLKVHVDSSRKLLEGDGPAGRKLDFLAQEFNRECNTICSKSNSAAVTSLGLDMKLVIDQFREQLQNIE